MKFETQHAYRAMVLDTLCSFNIFGNMSMLHELNFYGLAAAVFVADV